MSARILAGHDMHKGLIGRPPGPVAAPAPAAVLGAFPTLPGPDIVEPVAAATRARNICRSRRIGNV